MKLPNRDVLFLVKDEFKDDELIKIELEWIHHLLMSFETSVNVCKVHEIHDLNRYKKISRHSGVEKVLYSEKINPFVFVFNKN
jgi:hypothetical protein